MHNINNVHPTNNQKKEKITNKNKEKQLQAIYDPWT